MELPPGWEEGVAADGRKYYINHRTQSTHWEPPPSPRQQQQQPQAPMQAPSPGRPRQAPQALEVVRVPPTPLMQLVARGFVLSDAEKELERQGGRVEAAAEALEAKLQRSIEHDRSTLELLQSEGTAEEHLASLRTGLEQLITQLDRVEARRPADAGPPEGAAAGDDVQERLQRAQTTISHLTQTNLLLQQEPGAELMVEENLQQIAHCEAEIARLTPTPRREDPPDGLGAPPVTAMEVAAAGDDVQERLQRAQTTISHLTQTNLLLQQEPGAELMVDENLQQIAHCEAEIARLTPTPRRENPPDGLGAPPVGVACHPPHVEAELEPELELEPEPEPDDGTPIFEPEPQEEIVEDLADRVERPMWEWEKEWLGWYRFEPEHSDLIETAHAQGDDSLTYRAKRFSSEKEFEYTVDFRTMRQTNKESGKQRAVRRIICFVPTVDSGSEPDAGRALQRCDSGRRLGERDEANGRARWQQVLSVHEGGLEVIFRKLDADGDGHLTVVELKHGLAGLGLTDTDYEDMLHVVDKDGDGQISLAEIRTLAYMEQHVRSLTHENMQMCSDESQVDRKIAEVSQLRESLRASLRLSNSLELDDDAVDDAQQQLSQPDVTLSLMHQKWTEAKQLQRSCAAMQAQIKQKRVAMQPHAALQKELFDLQKQLEGCVTAAVQTELAAPILSGSAAWDVRLQANKLEWTWAEDSEPGGADDTPSASRSLFSRVGAQVLSPLRGALKWNKGTPAEVCEDLRGTAERERAVVLRFSNAPGKKQSVRLANANDAEKWINQVTAPMRAPSAAISIREQQLVPPLDHDKVDVRVVRPGGVRDTNVAELVSQLDNPDYWAKVDTGEGDNGLRLTLDAGRLAWAHWSDGTETLGSLDPCNGIRLIRSAGYGFAGRQDDGVWTFFSFRGDRQENKKKIEFWSRALANYMPATMIGVSLQFLKRFISQRDVGERTTEQVNFQIVKPASEAAGLRGEGCAYVDMLRGQNSHDLGLSSVFVSHAWKYPFHILVQAIETWETDPRYFRQRSGSKYWIDIFCKNQHDVVPSEVDKEFITSIESAWDVYSNQPQLLFVVHPWPDPVALSRIWCLFELQTGLIHQSRLHFQMSLDAKTTFERDELIKLATMPLWARPGYNGELFPKFGTWIHAKRCVDVERAEATKKSDIAMIMNGPAVLTEGKVPGIKQLEAVEDKQNPAFYGIDGRCTALAGVARMNASLKFQLEKNLLDEYWHRELKPGGGGVSEGHWVTGAPSE